MTFTLERFEQSNRATYGHLVSAGGANIAVTLERPWKDNQPHVSCIPAGTYTAFLRKSHLHGGDGKRDYDVWQLENVPGRDDIQIHIANVPSELLGCIALGTTFGEIANGLAVTGSRNAFNIFMARTKDLNAITLVIKDPQP